MRTAHAAIFAMAVGLAVGAPGPAAAACKLETVAEYPLVMHGDLALVDAAIDGKPVRFLLDTGASTTLLTRTAAKQLGLTLVPLQGVTFYGAGGRVEAERARIRELRLGRTLSHDVDMVVTGWMQSRSFVGLFGSDLLAKGDVELDFAGGMVRLFRPEGCQGDEVVYWNKPYSMAPIAPSTIPGAVMLNVTLNGRRALALLDTGAERSVVTSDAARQVGVTPQSRGVASVGATAGLGGLVQTWVGAFETLGVGDEKIQNAELELADLFSRSGQVTLGSRIPVTPGALPQMLLGADFVRAHRIYIARSQGKIYFSYNGGQIFKSPGEKAPRPAPPKP